MQLLRHYLLAVQYFTRIPVTGRLAAWVGYSPAMLRCALGHFPGVGWLVGTLAALVYGVLLWALGGGMAAALVAAVFATTAGVLLTGGLHEDGLADVADGLGTPRPRERTLEIMKDSHIGAFGTLALVLALLGKTALLACLGQHGVATVAVLMVGAHALSRLWPLWLVRTMAHVGDATASKSHAVAAHVGTRALAVAALWCCLPLVLVQQWAGTAALLACVLASAPGAVWLRWRFAQRLHGYTGDCLGAVQQVTEIGFLLGGALALGGVVTRFPAHAAP